MTTYRDTILPFRIMLHPDADPVMLEEELITQVANDLIAALMVPDTSLGYSTSRPDPERFKLFGIPFNSIPCNWIGLSANATALHSGAFDVEIDECSPDAPELLNWMHGSLRAYGFNISEVRGQW